LEFSGFIQDEFVGKTVIITGASRGLGRAIAIGLGKLGANVVCTARGKADLDQVVAEIIGVGGCALGITCDVTLEDQVNAMVDAAREQFGQIDMLVNNAGGPGQYEWVVNYTLQEWNRVFALNLNSAFLCCKAVLPGMIARKKGKIVNIASGVREERVGFGVSAYHAAKAALINFTRQLAAEMKRHTVWVNALDPGGLLTEFSDGVLLTEKKKDILQGMQTNKNPEIRLRPPEDVVPTVVFLLSAASDIMTGRLLQASSRDDVQYLQL
jgi:3-oxoacyl-[acyl-carrier protein] reductase